MGRGVYLAKENAAALLVEWPLFDDGEECLDILWWWKELEKDVIAGLPDSYWIEGRKTTDRGHHILAENSLVSVSVHDEDTFAVVETSVRLEAQEAGLYPFAMRHVDLARDIIGRYLASLGYYKLLVRASAWTVAIDDRFSKGVENGDARRKHCALEKT